MMRAENAKSRRTTPGGSCSLQPQPSLCELLVTGLISGGKRVVFPRVAATARIDVYQVINLVATGSVVVDVVSRSARPYDDSGAEAILAVRVAVPEDAVLVDIIIGGANPDPVAGICIYVIVGHFVSTAVDHSNAGIAGRDGAVTDHNVSLHVVISVVLDVNAVSAIHYRHVRFEQQIGSAVCNQTKTIKSNDGVLYHGIIDIPEINAVREISKLTRALDIYIVEPRRAADFVVLDANVYPGPIIIVGAGYGMAVQ